MSCSRSWPKSTQFFFDSKSDQSALPLFSAGARDDLAQRRFIEAHQQFWADSENNPPSVHYDGHMVDLDQITLWAWDARPFPWFPQDRETWSDGENWERGHWLNGRLGGCSIQELLQAILEDHEFQDFEIKLDGQIDGYVVPAQSSARQTLEPLLSLFDVHVSDVDGKLKFFQHPYADHTTLNDKDIVQEESEPKIIEQRVAELELPSEAILNHASVFNEFEQSISKSRRLNGGSDRQVSLNLPAVMPTSTASHLADFQLRKTWASRKTKNLTVASSRIDIAAGDIIRFEAEVEGAPWRVESVEAGSARSIQLRSTGDDWYSPGFETDVPAIVQRQSRYGKPFALLLDLPLLREEEPGRSRVYVATSAKPWAGSYNVFSSPSNGNFSLKLTVNSQATMGRLVAPLLPGPVSRFDNANTVSVAPFSGNYFGAEVIDVLNGSNALAVETGGGGYEILQFTDAELQSGGSWRLSGLLRGQLGTSSEMLLGSPVGANVVLLNNDVSAIDLQAGDKGRAFNWRIGPAREPVSSNSYTNDTFTYQARSSMMLSPVHLHHARNLNSQGAVFTWIRSGRHDADSWENAEIPLDALKESYLVRLLNADGEPERELVVSEPSFEYSDAEASADFGGLNASYSVEVAQIGDTGFPGAFAKITT